MTVMRFGIGFVNCGLGLHPAQPDTETEKQFYRSRYKNRNVIERFFGRIKRSRRVATRYEKNVVNFVVSSGSPRFSRMRFECPYYLEAELVLEIEDFR